VVEAAEELRQDARLRDADDHAGDAEDRADREVDVAGDDDEHHAGRHHRDRGGLDRQVPQVARRQEDAAGEQVEADPDRRQRRQHADEPQVELEMAEARAQRRSRKGR
jgi:hypothetical protein